MYMQYNSLLCSVSTWLAIAKFFQYYSLTATPLCIELFYASFFLNDFCISCNMNSSDCLSNFNFTFSEKFMKFICVVIILLSFALCMRFLTGMEISCILKKNNFFNMFHFFLFCCSIFFIHCTITGESSQHRADGKVQSSRGTRRYSLYS